MPPVDHSAKIARLETQDEELYRRDDALAGVVKELKLEVRDGFKEMGDQLRRLQLSWAAASGAVGLATFLFGFVAGN